MTPKAMPATRIADVQSNPICIGGVPVGVGVVVGTTVTVAVPTILPTFALTVVVVVVDTDDAMNTPNCDILPALGLSMLHTIEGHVMVELY